jgi:hypothetical protein
MAVQPMQAFGGIATSPNGGVEQKGNFRKIVVNSGFDSADKFPRFI